LSTTCCKYPGIFFIRKGSYRIGFRSWNPTTIENSTSPGDN
jgi:hypothetical protein